MTAQTGHTHLNRGTMHAIVQEGYGTADIFRHRKTLVPTIAEK